MEDIGVARQAWKWICSHKHVYTGVGNGAAKLRDSIAVFTRNYWPIICRWFVSFCGLVMMLWKKWLNCMHRGFHSFRGLDSAALFVILWSSLLSLTSMLCLLYIFIGLLAAGAVILQLGFTPGIFIVGLFGILTLWMYANLWIAAILFMAGGYLFSLNHTRLVVFMAVTYALYSVKVQVGWRGVFLSLNFAFITNDLFNFLVQWCDNVAAEKPYEEKEDSTDSVTPEKSSTEGDYTIPKTHKNNSSKRPIKTTPNYHIDNGTQNSTKKMKTDTSSVSEMNRILKSTNHYESLGLSRHKFDISSLRKEYRKKAMLVHPDKNMGVSLASDSFKMLQCAYEVLSDSTKKQEYDKQLRKDDMRVIPKGYHTSCEDNSGCNSEQSRRISCTKCGNLHIWVCTSRSKTKARWCQNCGQYHQAKDGDGWVEYKASLLFEIPHKMEIPRAFVCAESKIYDVSEWAICQGMACRPNTHRPSFHVNMVGLDLKMKSQRWKHQSDGNEDDDRDEFETWLKQALASGFFHETCSSSRTRRKSWSPFIRLNPKKKSPKEWRRSV